jgi:hypothetical protein
MVGGWIWKAVKVLSEHLIEAEKTDKAGEKERKKKEA